jgi:mevalonate kinase
MGSGADVAASVRGGTVAYRQDPRDVRRLSQCCPITAVYSGAKKPTPEVVARVESLRVKHPRSVDAIFRLMGETAEQAVSAVERRDWRRAGELFNLNQGFMEAIGVSNEALSAIVYALRSDPAVYGAKISGSGLGDCVVGLGRAAAEVPGYERLDVEASPEGFTVD